MYLPQIPSINTVKTTGLCHFCVFLTRFSNDGLQGCAVCNLGTMSRRMCTQTSVLPSVKWLVIMTPKAELAIRVWITSLRYFSSCCSVTVKHHASYLEHVLFYTSSLLNLYWTPHPHPPVKV